MIPTDMNTGCFADYEIKIWKIKECHHFGKPEAEFETIRHILHRKSIPFTGIEENGIQDLIVGGSYCSTYECTCFHLTSVHHFHRCECEYHQACAPLSSVCGILHLVDT